MQFGGTPILSRSQITGPVGLNLCVLGPAAMWREGDAVQSVWWGCEHTAYEVFSFPSAKLFQAAGLPAYEPVTHAEWKHLYCSA